MKTKSRRRLRVALSIAAVILLLAVGAAAFLLTEPAGVRYEADIPILMYHHLIPESAATGEFDGMTVTAERLEADLLWLRENGYETVLPRELAAGEPLPEKPVMITFDDGYRSNYELLFPLLQKYQMKAAIAVIVKNQDNNSANHLSWDMCREMTESGLVEIGSHTYDLHQTLDEHTRGVGRKTGEKRPGYWLRVLPDLLKSYSRIRKETGAAPTMFAYPYGATEATLLTPLHRLFRVTLTTQTGTASLRGGLYELSRYAVRMDITPAQILAP